MNLLGTKLEFGNEKQRLICRRLDEDYSKMARDSYLSKQVLSAEQLLKLKSYLEVKDRWKHISDQYEKSLLKLQMDDIMADIMAPIMESKKKYYEEYFAAALNEKRKIAVDKIKKHMEKAGLYSGQVITAPF